jgi:hypothetical protein
MLAAKGIVGVTKKQLRDLAGGIQTGLRSHEGDTVARVGDGVPMRWALIAK